METWQRISSIEGYEISSKGRVKSIRRYVVHPNGVQQLVPERILSTYLNSNGYAVVSMRIQGVKSAVKRKVHRLVAEAFLPNPDRKRTVNHKDLNKLNNAVENLEVHTHLENISHAVSNGVQFGRTGEQASASKLTTESVIAIRSRVAQGELLSTVAKDYNIATRTVWSISVGRTWKHIPDFIEQCKLQIAKRLIR